MKWLLDLFASSLGRKLLVALTGIFLILFLAIHLVGNLQLLKGDGGRAFNVYAAFMTSNPLIQIVSKLNFFFIVLHVVVSLLLTARNRQARGSDSYALTSGKSSVWASRNMAVLGTLVLIFMVVHLKDFYAQMHWGGISTKTYDGQVVRDLYTLVDFWFGKAWYVALYCFCMAALAFHLWHGFASAFQTLGLNHMKYNPVIEGAGKAFAVVVPVLYALIPLWMFFA